jgi:hypothetical protein
MENKNIVVIFIVLIILAIGLMQFLNMRPYRCYAVITFVNHTHVKIVDIRETTCGGLMLCIACSRVEAQTEVYLNEKLVCNSTGYVITLFSNNTGVNVPSPCEALANLSKQNVKIVSTGRISNNTVGNDTKILTVPEFEN